MVITQITGGLGNQMFQYAIGKAISLQHNEILKLDITSYDKFKPHNGYRLNALNINENIANPSEIKKFRLLSYFSTLSGKQRLKEQERTIYDPEVFKYNNVYLNGYWHNENYFKNIKNILEKEFTPKESLSIDAKNYLQTVIGSNSISVHIRRGDYLKHPNLGVLDLNYYKRAIKFFLENQQNPIFYFFSDDLNWCKENFSFVERKIFIENTLSEVEDLHLMTNCRHNIIANSTFSWWGAWLNNNVNKMVIAPQKWMAHNPKNYSWVPNTWKQF